MSTRAAIALVEAITPDALTDTGRTIILDALRDRAVPSGES